MPLFSPFYVRLAAVLARMIGPRLYNSPKYEAKVQGSRSNSAHIRISMPYHAPLTFWNYVQVADPDPALLRLSDPMGISISSLSKYFIKRNFSASQLLRAKCLGRAK